MGRHVVILLDSITRLARGYNAQTVGQGPADERRPGFARRSSSRRSSFPVARNTEEGGSLTILATALVDTGSRADEVIFEEFKGTGNMELHLDRELVEKRIYPAIHILKSGTRREELLYHPDELERVQMIRKQLDPAAAGRHGGAAGEHRGDQEQHGIAAGGAEVIGRIFCGQPGRLPYESVVAPFDLDSPGRGASRGKNAWCGRGVRRPAWSVSQASRVFSYAPAGARCSRGVHPRLAPWAGFLRPCRGWEYLTEKRCAYNSLVPKLHLGTPLSPKLGFAEMARRMHAARPPGEVQLRIQSRSQVQLGNEENEEKAPGKMPGTAGGTPTLPGNRQTPQPN